MARTDPQLNFRCPQELRDRLDEAATKNKRSLTAEVINRLEGSFHTSPSDGLISDLNEHLMMMAEQNKELIKEIKSLKPNKKPT